MIAATPSLGAVDGLVLVLLGVAAVSDGRHRLIPNWVSAALLLLFVGAGLVEGRWAAVGAGMAVAALTLAVAYGAFRLGVLGGGDVKLITAVAAWAGPAGMPTVLAVTCLSGGVLAVAIAGAALAVRARGGETPALRRLELPYGIAIAIGGAAWVIQAAQAAAQMAMHPALGLIGKG